MGYIFALLMLLIWFVSMVGETRDSRIHILVLVAVIAVVAELGVDYYQRHRDVGRIEEDTDDATNI